MLKPTIANALSTATRRIPDDVLPDMNADLAALRTDIGRVLGPAAGSDEIHHEIDQACVSLSQLEQSLAQLRRVITETAASHQ